MPTALLKFNENHAAAGTPIGGEFVSEDESGGHVDHLKQKLKEQSKAQDEMRQHELDMDAKPAPGKPGFDQYGRPIQHKAEVATSGIKVTGKPIKVKAVRSRIKVIKAPAKTDTKAAPKQTTDVTYGKPASPGFDQYGRPTHIQKFNPNHVPAGNSNGGQFGNADGTTTNKVILPSKLTTGVPSKALQPTNDPEKLYALGAEANDQMATWLDKGTGIVSQMGGKTVTKLPATAEEWKALGKGPVLVEVPLKSIGRATDKVNSELDGRWDRLLDVSRASIAVDTVGDAQRMIDRLSDSGMQLARPAKDRLNQATLDGYRADFLFNTRMPNGMVTELQVGLKPMFAAKQEGHVIYEQVRSLDDRHAGVPPEQWSAEDRATRAQGVEQMRNIYSRAWDKAVLGKLLLGGNLRKAVGAGYFYIEWEGNYYRGQNKFGIVADVLKNGIWVNYTGKDRTAIGVYGTVVSQGEVAGHNSLLKFNQNHDAKGEFSSSAAEAGFTSHLNRAHEHESAALKANNPSTKAEHAYASVVHRKASEAYGFASKLYNTSNSFHADTFMNEARKLAETANAASDATTGKLLKYNPNHVPAGSSQGGQFGTAGGESEGMKDMLGRLSKPDGGFTYQPATDDEPKEGFAVSIYPGRSFAMDGKDLKLSDLSAYVAKNQDVFGKAEHYLGAWHDPATGRVYLDVSVVKKTAGEAEHLALAHDQIAYFDLKGKKSVDVNRNAKSGGAAGGGDGKT